MWRKFYEVYIDTSSESESHEVRVTSPFRSDSNPSLYINLSTGQFNDFGDADFKGDPINWLMLVHEASYEEASRIVKTYTQTGKHPSPPLQEEVLDFHQQLLQSKNTLNYLSTRGITKQIIDEYMIGYDGDRIIIPVIMSNGICINARKYDPNSSSKMLPYQTGYGSVKLYPLVDYDASQPTFLCEGEWDALVLKSWGFNALTNTGGANTWKKEWCNILGTKIYMCYDGDDAGRKGTENVIRYLEGSSKSFDVKIVPIPEGKDITDLYKEGYNESSFKKLIEKAAPPSAQKEETIVQLPRFDLCTSINAENKGVMCRLALRVVGYDNSPYNVPVEIISSCSGSQDFAWCTSCPLFSTSEKRMSIRQDEFLLKLLKITDVAQLIVLKNLLGIPSKCCIVKIKTTKSVNIYELIVAPEVEQSGMSKYVLQVAFVITDDISSNTSFYFDGKMIPSPWLQKTILFLNSAEPVQQQHQNFKMDSEIFRELFIFQQGDFTIKEKLAEIHNDFEKVTDIIGRQDLLTSIDLTYHSVLNFKLQGKPVGKGYVEMLVLGDTRTGKSETIEAMMKHFQLGEISTAENTSFSGLVGGLQQQGDKRWFVTWGKLPQNNGKLFIIDEASGLSKEDIGNMSGVRSNGVAEITKIVTERTNAKTRLIWLSNPRQGTGLDTTTYGCSLIKELIGNNEDIARFDFCVSTSREDVSPELINAKRSFKENAPLKYCSEACKLLILWAWSRTPEQIHIDEGAVDLILKYAIEQGQKYSSSIPLVEGANQRIKLAKLAVAIACRLFSTEDGENVIVNKEHVQFAYDFLTEIYAKKSFDYEGYSLNQIKNIKVAESKVDVIASYLKAHQLIDAFNAPFVTFQTLKEQCGLKDDDFKALFKDLIDAKMLEEYRRGEYIKTAPLLKLIKKLREDERNDTNKESSNFV